ncbi:4Fe-4S dicluster domain-containing protein [bacterium]|nr:4Fe-4S dicluster domain-containing protein [bacterium]MBU1984262.1 4Fe-4S dicluster domain-containing protein [bacterium]
MARNGEIQVDFARRRELESVLGAGHVGYCYQCGACVGDCPTARFHGTFNPRTIMLQALLGDLDDLLQPESVIWLCSNCYNCYERCPQDVRPVEVIIALKNLCVKQGHISGEIVEVSKRVRETGRSVPVMPSINRMRQDLGLPPLEELDVSDLKKILPQQEEESGS